MSLHLDTQSLPSPDGIIDMMGEENQTPSRSDENMRFRQSFERAMPSSRKPKQYDNVGVLMLSFDPTCNAQEIADMDVNEEVQELARVFRNDYNFDVTTEVIHSNDDAQSQAYTHISQFRLRQSRKKHALSILYYAGHAWRSLDKKRKRKGGFDLTRGQVVAELSQPEGTYIMWEAAEKLLHHMKGDVLVIFDCCDSGYLDGRGPGYSFDYLVACAEHKKTWKPSSHSFTSALIWALKELKPDPNRELATESKPNRPFKVQELRDKIREHPPFPHDQEPRIFPRWSHMTEPIWLSPIPKKPVSPTYHDGPSARLRSSSTASDTRPEECSYVDLRFFFKEDITIDDAPKVARMVSAAVQDQSLELNARHVSVLEFGSITPPRERLRKAFNSIRAANSFSRRSHLADDAYEEEDLEPPVRKRAKINHSKIEQNTQPVLNSLSVSQRPVTPMSEGPPSDAETHIDLHFEPGAVWSVEVRRPLNNDPSTTTKVVGIRIRSTGD
ncbi:hypothetical protein BU23DRAFT_603371 [Bimuria novae-zelandiae CBS 107.79]|uniref:Uncharacterized protein n=1 Tax=Bimuria novae-zelandiae CBS 107.79 TaxID=1447943 RepID=A0A6A5UV11_9PLEO|nr:hypothetical protein BU23DRAFT_603371 [Bimuria novae-zelandiae CBS 107.79]